MTAVIGSPGNRGTPVVEHVAEDTESEKDNYVAEQ